MDFKNLKTSENTGSGVAEKILLAPVSWFTSIKMPVPPFLYPGQGVTILEDHVFKEEKSFFEVWLSPEKNQLSGATIGELGFQKMDLQLEVFIPGSYAELHEFAKNIINRPLVALIHDSDCRLDWYYQLGDECVYAWMKCDFTTGTTRDGIKGYKGTVSYLKGSILMYKGAAPVISEEELWIGDDDNDLVDEDGVTLMLTK